VSSGHLLFHLAISDYDVTEPIAMIGLNKDPGRLRAYDDRGMPSLKRLAQAVEEHDCRLLGQVQDPGRGRHEVGRNDAAIGVSALPDDLSWTSRMS
jgi:2,4-dienoyl-CoA reductase-like NADH-dependent reductase (Old Yellow Enzyme family)